jgi:PAS domain-containing protein
LPARRADVPLSSWADLLFSSKAAWIWDAGSGEFIWASASARARFGEDLTGFRQSLPRPTLRRLKAVSGFKRRPLSLKEPLALRAADVQPVLCELEGLRLVDGRFGLIIREASADDVTSPQSPSQRRPRNVLLPQPQGTKLRPKQAAGTGAKQRSQPSLSAEELACFRAVGRRVRKLCAARNTQGQATADASVRSSSPACELQEITGGAPAPRPDALLLQAFDAFVELRPDGVIQTVSGRFSRSAGWGMRSYAGADVEAFAAAQDQPRLRALLEKAIGEPARAVSGELMLQSRDGRLLPCRVIFGLRPTEGALPPHRGGMWMAVISLKMPPRLLRALTSGLDPAPASRRAA